MVCIVTSYIVVELMIVLHIIAPHLVGRSAGVWSVGAHASWRAEPRRSARHPAREYALVYIIKNENTLALVYILSRRRLSRLLLSRRILSCRILSRRNSSIGIRVFGMQERMGSSGLDPVEVFVALPEEMPWYMYYRATYYRTASDGAASCRLAFGYAGAHGS